LNKANNRERANFRLIECELYNYHESKKELALMREEIIEGSTYQEVSVQASPGNVTQSKVFKLNSAEIMEVTRRINAIEKAIEILRCGAEPRKLRLLEMKYFERNLTDRGIWQALFIEQATYYRWRKEIIKLIADRLGYKIQ